MSSMDTWIATGHLRNNRLSVDDYTIEVVEGPHQGQKLSLQEEVSRIGRAEWCDLSLPLDRRTSSLHCECWLEPQGVRIKDLNSRNGVFLQGCQVFDAYWPDGTVVQVGNSSLKLKNLHSTQEIHIITQDDSGTIVGQSPAMRKLFGMIRKIAQRNIPTLLQGETGTGKTTVARAIHDQGPRAGRPFVVVNCGALPHNLIEASLFGYEKGAFTGATKRHHGYFEQANGGTLFLDEIAELPLSLQPKLLDVLERKCIRRLGSEGEVRVDFRLVSATHKDLTEEIAAQRFRQDLFFRCATVTLEIPPLRERKKDIPLLLDRWLRSLLPSQSLQFTRPALDTLCGYSWPGNIRQLYNVLESAVTFLDGNTIDVKDLYLPGQEEEPAPTPSLFSMFPDVQPAKKEPSVDSLPASLPISPSYPTPPARMEPGDFALKSFLGEVEKALIVQALEYSNDNVQEAALRLGITGAWLYNRIKKYGLRD
ncbi:MAG: sigma 54-dependent Fis family transcriptional regulator [Deltaproteobacteria bacterium]|nr:MAG: sigma 54-dependent Fis family transcriptional regulator [Deltaproteobacteria bacterium]